MSPRDVREVRIVFDVSDDLSVKSADPEEGGEVAHSAEPFARRASPAEIPLEEDRGAVRPTPSIVHLLCRGPFQLLEVPWIPVSGDNPGGGPAFGFRFISRHNGTSAGPDGKDLAPGTCALRDRPLRSDEPTETIVLAPTRAKFVEPSEWARPPHTPQDALTLAEEERQVLAGKLYELAAAELALSHLSNFLTRSDYVVELMAHRNIGVVAAPRYETRWGSDGNVGFPRFTPFPAE
jgi:hypothetical protein